VLALTAAGSVLEIYGVFYQGTFLLFPYLDSFAFCFCQASARCLMVVSALVPIAQMNPSSSRATAVMIFPSGCRPHAASYTACASGVALSTQFPWPLPTCSLVACATHTKCKVADDSFMLLRQRFVASAPRSGRAALRLVGAGRSAKGICSTMPSSIWSCLAASRARTRSRREPRNLYPDPIPPSDHRSDSNVPASQHPAGLPLPDHLP